VDEGQARNRTKGQRMTFFAIKSNNADTEIY